MKRIISLFLCILFVLTAAPLSALADMANRPAYADDGLQVEMLSDKEMKSKSLGALYAGSEVGAEPAGEEPPAAEAPIGETPEALVPEPGGGELPVPAEETPLEEAPDAPESPILAASVTVTAQDGKTALAAGEALQLFATVLPEDAADKRVAWSSDSEAAATVDETGLVRCVSAGTAVITATAMDGSGVFGTITLTLGEAPEGEPEVVPVSGIMLTAPEGKTALAAGETLQLTATVTPADATEPGLLWSSSDEAIATVDETGLVRCVSAGAVVITATAMDGSGVFGTVTLTLGKAPEGLTEGDWIYRIDDNGFAVIIGYLNASVTSLSVPYTLGGCYVTGVDPDALSGLSVLTSAAEKRLASSMKTAISVNAMPGCAMLCCAAYSSRKNWVSANAMLCSAIISACGSALGS